MPTKKWDPTKYPAVLHRAIAVYVILQAYGFDVENDVCNCISSRSFMVILQADEIEELVFHIGEPDRSIEEMARLIQDYTRAWQGMSEDDFVTLAKEYLPITAMHPIVVAELQGIGFFGTEEPCVRVH